jgi:hypothetical protein
MSEASAPRRVLHLVIEGFPTARLEEVAGSSPGTADVAEIFQLTEANAREALEKIFAADTVAVWSNVSVRLD